MIFIKDEIYIHCVTLQRELYIILYIIRVLYVKYKKKML